MFQDHIAFGQINGSKSWGELMKYYSLESQRYSLVFRLTTIVVLAIVIIATVLESKLDSADKKLANNLNNGGSMAMKNIGAAKNCNGNGDAQITVISTDCTVKGCKESLEMNKETEVSGRKCTSEQSNIGDHVFHCGLFY